MTLMTKFQIQQTTTIQRNTVAQNVCGKLLEGVRSFVRQYNML